MNSPRRDSYFHQLAVRLDGLAAYLTDATGTIPMPENGNVPVALREAAQALRDGPSGNAWAQEYHLKTSGLYAERDALVPDARRYRWLRDKDIENVFPRKGLFVGEIRRPEARDAVLTGIDADRAIDAEIERGSATHAGPK